MEKSNEKPLKIGLFCDSFFPMMDGVAMVVDNYARILSKKHDVTVFVPSGREPFDDSKLPYKVVRCTKKLGVFFLDYDLPRPKKDKAFQKAVRDANLDIIHLHSPVTMGKFGLKIAKEQQIPVIMHAHSQFKQDIRRSAKSRILTNLILKGLMKTVNGCDECWMVNKRAAQVFLDYGTKIPIKVQDNGTEFVPNYEDKSEIVARIRNEFSVEKDEKLLLYVGRLNLLKNLMLLCDAMKILKDKNFKFKLMMVGTGQDEDKLRKRIKKNGIENEVILTGKIVDRKKLTQIFAAADLFVFPSLYDTNSLTPIEAASQRTATLFIDGAVTSGNATYEVDSFASANTPEAYADKIIEIFQNPKHLSEVAAAAQKNLCISWEDAIASAEQDYYRLVQNNSKAEKLRTKKR